jgi:hypothetical protein
LLFTADTVDGFGNFCCAVYGFPPDVSVEMQVVTSAMRTQFGNGFIGFAHIGTPSDRAHR